MSEPLTAIPERTNRPISFTIVDQDRAPVTPATLTMLLYDETSGTAIRAKADALNTGGVTVSSGAVVWQPTPEENRIINEAVSQERHVMLWEWTWDASGVTRHEKGQIVFTVQNLSHVS